MAKYCWVMLETCKNWQLTQQANSVKRTLWRSTCWKSAIKIVNGGCLSNYSKDIRKMSDESHTTFKLCLSWCFTQCYWDLIDWETLHIMSLSPKHRRRVIDEVVCIKLKKKKLKINYKKVKAIDGSTTVYISLFLLKRISKNEFYEHNFLRRNGAWNKYGKIGKLFNKYNYHCLVTLLLTLN